MGDGVTLGTEILVEIHSLLRIHFPLCLSQLAINQIRNIYTKESIYFAYMKYNNTKYDQKIGMKY